MIRVEKSHMEPRNLCNSDLARSRDKNNRTIKLSDLAPRKRPLCSGIKNSRTKWDAEAANF